MLVLGISGHDAVLWSKAVHVQRMEKNGRRGEEKRREKEQRRKDRIRLACGDPHTGRRGVQKL